MVPAPPPPPIIIEVDQPPAPNLADVETSIRTEERGLTLYCRQFLAEHSFRPAVARWCPLVVKHFTGEWTHWALHVMACESRGDPNIKSRRSSATGLFQHLARYWPNRAARAGWEGYPRTHAEANIAVSAWLFNDGAGRSHWKCKSSK